MNTTFTPIQVNVERNRPVIDAALRHRDAAPDAAFQDTMKGVMADAPGRKPSVDEARKAAEQFVSSAFIVPIFEMMQEATKEMEGPFAPGLVEERFMPMLHERLADEITQSGQFGLVDAIVNRLAGPQQPAAASAGSTGGLNVIG